jgi:GINS complex subunit 3
MRAGNYWSKEEFLAEEEQVLSRFDCDGKGLAYLDPQADPKEEDIQKGKEVKLPLWLALNLAEKDYLHIDAPLYLKSAYKDTMKADPTSVNLKERSSYLYETGKTLQNFINDPDLIPTLKTVFKERYKKIVDYASSTRVSEISDFAARLTRIEREMFDTRQEYLRLYEVWKNRGGSKIEVRKEIVPTGKRWKSN